MDVFCVCFCGQPPQPLPTVMGMTVISRRALAAAAAAALKCCAASSAQFLAQLQYRKE
jgi:hypothetical protein